MKKYIKHITVLLIAIMFTSCLVDDTAPSDLNDQGPNLISFEDSSTAIGGIATGEEYEFELNMLVKGPTSAGLSSDVSATISIDPSSTAIEGTHFKLDSKTVSFTNATNYLNQLPITLLTDGIVPPLAVSPVLVLNVESAQGTNVINNGNPIQITLNYLCPSTLSRAYSVVGRYVHDSAGIDRAVTGTDFIDEVGDGQYRTRAVGHWEVEGGPGAIGGTAGFDFTDVCDQISIPEQNLVELYSNIVEGVSGESTVNPDTGVISFNYTVCSGDNCRVYSFTYTPL